MKIIGVTGGISSGKSTVSAYLAAKGYAIIDADHIAREITLKGSPLLTDLSQTFGSDILNSDGTLERKKLAAIAFSSPQNHQRLNEIMHGKIKEIILQTMKALIDQGHKLAFIDAPLLIESGLDHVCDCVWVICAPDEIRINRAISRDCSSVEEIKKRIALQLTDEQRLKASAAKTEKIDNSAGREELYEKIDELLEKYE